MNINWNKLEQFLGGLKFAVIIILCFAMAMVVGTFLESYYGTDFANRMVYKTLPFMLIQFGMLMSIIFAAFLRLPPKKRLYGFYTIHSGLVIIGIGSMITYIAGVDGNIVLAPNEPNRQVILSKDILKITYPEEGQQVTRELPYNAFATAMNESYDDIQLLEYIPFAEGQFVWAQPINSYSETAPIHSSRYQFKNAFAEENLTFTLHPEATSEFTSNASLGPLTFYYMPENLARCFEKPTLSGVILWNVTNGECFSAEEKNLPVKTTGSKNRFVVYPQAQGPLLTFFPDISPYPLTGADFKADQQSIIRAFSQTVFEAQPTLFLFGKKVAFYSKDEKKWSLHALKAQGAPVILPWMKAEIKLIDHQETSVPFRLPISTVPIQKNGAIIKGGLRAVKLAIMGREYWATNESPLTLLIGGKKVIIEVTKESLTLPFELSLSQFKMDKDPGTNNPASYESFLKLFSDGKMSNHHVFMNHPLKHQGFTFYQASYSQDSAGNYGSTLAVNVDQGRPLKYLGSLMLVFGAIWHYNLNKKKKGAAA